MIISIIDYGAGNITSLINALELLDYSVKIVQTPEDIYAAKVIIFPGVGAFDTAIEGLEKLNLIPALIEYISDNRPFLGICIGMQVLFDGSEEGSRCGLGIFRGRIRALKRTKTIPHMGYNVAISGGSGSEKFYFVHSYACFEMEDAMMVTGYGDEVFVSAVRRGNVVAVQFHPEKSGRVGLEFIRKFIEGEGYEGVAPISTIITTGTTSTLSRRIIPCLDVRADENNKLVVTKGDQYDVRSSEGIRNLGDPIQMAEKYYNDGADELAFLNITGFRTPPLEDQPMLDLVRCVAKKVFIPFTIGGGIRGYTCASAGGKVYSAVDVADAYFKAGADKVSIGSDAITAAEEYYMSCSGSSSSSCSIRSISAKYGRQAVVVSIDPRRVYVSSPSDTERPTHKTCAKGPNGEEYVWFQCTKNGGRVFCELSVDELVVACEALGAGEFLVNSIDKDGAKSGFDLELLRIVRSCTMLPVIASSGAGCPGHFVEAFECGADAGLAAGIFHREEVSISQVKACVKEAGFAVNG